MDDDNNQMILNNQDIDMLNTIDLNQHLQQQQHQQQQNSQTIINKHVQKLNSSNNADSPMLDSNGDSLDDENDDDTNNQEMNNQTNNTNNNNNGDEQDDEDDDDNDSFILDYETKTPGEILDEFCTKLKDVNTTLPDTVVNHYMKKTGFIVNDPKLVKIISLASQKFISEIVNDVMQHHKLKTKSAASTASTSAAPVAGSSSNTAISASTSNNANLSTQTNATNLASTTNQKGPSSTISASNTNGLTLTLEDLSHVLTEYGINVKKPYYFM